MELGPNGEDFPPYEERKKIIFTFLLCWKHSKMTSFSKIPRDVIKIIADLIPVNLSYSFEYVYDKSRKLSTWQLIHDELSDPRWNVINVTIYSEGVSCKTTTLFSCCPICFRPPSLKSWYSLPQQLVCIKHGPIL